MEGQHYRCLKEVDFGEIKADIKVLKKVSSDNEAKIVKVEDKCEVMNDLGKAISLMSLNLDHIVEHNQRQDTMMENQNKTLENINSNLNELNQGQRNLHQGQENLDNKVAKLEERVDKSESKSIVDIRDIEKEKYIRYLKDYAVPFGVGTAVATLLLQLFKTLKG